MKSIVEIIRSFEQALTAHQLGKLLSMPKSSIYDLIASGSLPSYRINSTIRLDPKDTANWLQGRMVGEFCKA